jgi:hypothetical protein
MMVQEAGKSKVPHLTRTLYYDISWRKAEGQERNEQEEAEPIFLSGTHPCNNKSSSMITPLIHS